MEPCLAFECVLCLTWLLMTEASLPKNHRILRESRIQSVLSWEGHRRIIESSSQPKWRLATPAIGDSLRESQFPTHKPLVLAGETAMDAGSEIKSSGEEIIWF